MKIVVALTGASGQIVGIRLLEILKNIGAKTYVIVSKTAKKIIELETNYDLNYIKSLSYKFYDEDEITASIASGSFKHNGMAIVPCSIKTASSIAYGIADNLITRAADVTLKEKRKLIIGIREAPLHIGHLKTLVRLAEIGATVYPLVLSFYIKPKGLDDLIDYNAYRIAELLGVEVEYTRWSDTE